MEFSSFFPVWNRLTVQQQAVLSGSVFSRKVNRGDVIHNSDADCTGLLLVRSGQLRAFILSEDGREITIYRLFERDLCLFSASCMMRSIQFDV
ncbi:MAG: Crp/Fnr family transcriptional regulator, partial [Clostridia bacterium]|nr:Crp/Fnr family transcriptional regulator [Clostridia bacterium]